ncbi:MAG: molecular chaperone HtpG [bacterium]|nr:molecular chaperone HtpG [bacterium]
MTTKTETSITETPKTGTFEFQAETRQLLDIVIHSLYSSKEIFLRELISNASDALDRLRFEALTDPEIMGKDEQLEIKIDTNATARTLVISDNGIGMSRDEVITHIGTIAKSGTRELVAQLKESQSSEGIAQLIGQFGVGFYSAFMVAEKVTLLTRRAGEEKATRWESTGDGQFTIEDDHRFMRGTTITLELKPVDQDHGIDDFVDFWVIERIVKRYSDFVAYPIVTKQQREEPETDQDGKPIPEKTRTVIEDKTLNSMTPIWTRPRDEVTQEEYAEFFKHIAHDWNEPLDVLSLRAEGRIEYQALLFVPSKTPWDIYSREQQFGLQLYVRRILVMDHCEELVPPYLRFVKGVVDSADLPLSISREMIHQDRHIHQMRKWLTRKVLDHLNELREKDHEKYLKFWKELGQVLKEGVSHDGENRDRIAPLLYFQSSQDPEKLTTLAEYVERMKDDQEEIYYLSGESRRVVENSPHLEAFKAKGYEVLYLVDPVDEVLAPALPEYEGKKLKSVGKGTVELGSDEERKQAEEALKEKEKTYKELMKFLEKTLEEWVREVRLSARLTTSPVCLVGSEHDPSPGLERMMRESGEAGFSRQKRILELHPEHEILGKLKQRFAADKEDPALADYAHLLLGSALLAEGSELHEPAKYNRLVGELMVKGL